MKTLLKLSRISLLTSLCLVAACGTPGMLKKTDQKVSEKRAQLKANEANFMAQPLPLLEKQAGAWLTNRSIPIEDTVSLPPLFDKSVTFFSGQALPMTGLAEILEKEHKIRIRLAADIFNQKKEGSQGGGPGSGPNSRGNNKGGPDDALNGPSVRLQYGGTLRGLLDTIANKTMTHWTYHAGVVEFGRLQTRTFEINTMPGKSVYNANAGKNSGSNATGSDSGGGMQLGYNSSTTITTTSDLDYWKQMVQTVETMLSPDGTVMPSEMTNSITVTDNMATVEKVRRFVDSENAALSRQVKLSVQVYAVKLNENSMSGINWDLIARTVKGVSIGASGLAMPANLSSTGGSIVSQVESGFFNGSNLLIQALSQQGQVSTVVNTNVVTLNNQPAPVAVTDNQAYVSKITSVVGTISAVGNTTIEQSNLSTGFIINLLPTLLNNRSVMLQAQIDLSYLNALKDFSPKPEQDPNAKRQGLLDKVLKRKNSDPAESKDSSANKDNNKQGDTLSRVQLPHTSSIQTMQRASLKSGETLVLSGFRRTRYETNRSGIYAYEGGNKAANQMIEEIIVVISPYLTEGA